MRLTDHSARSAPTACWDGLRGTVRCSSVAAVEQALPKSRARAGGHGIVLILRACDWSKYLDFIGLWARVHCRIVVLKSAKSPFAARAPPSAQWLSELSNEPKPTPGSVPITFRSCGCLVHNCRASNVSKWANRMKSRTLTGVFWALRRFEYNDSAVNSRPQPYEIKVFRPVARSQDEDDSMAACAGPAFGEGLLDGGNARAPDGTAKAVPAGSRRRSGRVIRETHVRNIKS